MRVGDGRALVPRGARARIRSGRPMATEQLVVGEWSLKFERACHWSIWAGIVADAATIPAQKAR
jgi:hypothetical protein